MDTEDGAVRVRDKEIETITTFLTTRIINKESGILYLAGSTGTGKTMSIKFALNQIKDVPKVYLNCRKRRTSKSILTEICEGVKLDKLRRCSEVELLQRLEKEFSGKQNYILVLDEFDNPPKSINIDLINTIFSWPLKKRSRLILVGIANTLNCTSKSGVVGKIMGTNYLRACNKIEKIIFRPYSTQDIKSILMWYLENDENFEDASVDPRALDMIASKYSREMNGDIRSALDALTSAKDDTMRASRRKLSTRLKTPEPETNLPTPPATPTSTPPLSQRKECTNIASVANSIKKRSKRTLYEEDTIPLTHQIISTCIVRLSAKGVIDSRLCKNLTTKVLNAFGSNLLADDDYRQVLTYLETQGLILLKKAGPRDRIVLKVSETEICNFIPEKERIESLIDKIC